MLGTQPSHSAGESSHPALFTSKSVALATTEMMWAVALAATRASIASTARSLALWSQMLRAPIGPWSAIANPFACGADLSLDFSATRATATTDTSAQATTGGAGSADAPGEEAAAFASYRSLGGHATAQVITHN